MAPEYLRFISDVLSHLAWPIAVLILGVLFRRHLGDLLSSIAKLRFRDLEMDFIRLAESAEELPEEEPSVQPLSELDLTLYNSFQEQVTSVAAHSPSAAILLAWTGVETAMTSAVSRLSISPDPPSMRSSGHMLESLRRFAGLPSEVSQMIHEMRILRNRVAHDQSYGSRISAASATAYRDSAVRVIDFLSGFEGTRDHQQN